MTAYVITEDFYKRCRELFYVDDNFNLRRKMTVAPNALKDTVAGNYDNNMGYLRVKIERKSYLVHRIIYLMIVGDLPEIVDHIDGNPLNNTISNLRGATKASNRWNCKNNSGSQTGVKGVYIDGKKFKALITVSGKRYYLGMHETIDSARQAVENKYRELQGNYNFVDSRLKEG